MRLKIWYYIRKNREAYMLNKKEHILRFLLFPIDYFFTRRSIKSGYQLIDDTWIINGQKYSSEFFCNIKLVGSKFEVVKNEKGVITLRGLK